MTDRSGTIDATKGEVTPEDVEKKIRLAWGRWHDKRTIRTDDVDTLFGALAGAIKVIQEQNAKLETLRKPALVTLTDPEA